MITFKRPDGKPCGAYSAEPSAPGAPGIVVIQEWWGLTDQIKGAANLLAAAGYRVVVPDLHGVPEHALDGVTAGTAPRDFQPVRRHECQGPR
jgi:dienelactone hydrolase